MKPEQKLWADVRKVLGTKAHGVRVEASLGEAESGTPDLCLSYLSRTRWIELKVWPESLRVSQIAWAIQHEGRRCDPVLVLAKFDRDRLWLGHWRTYDLGNKNNKLPESKAIWVGTVKEAQKLLEFL